MEDSLLRNLPAFRALTGWDITSQFTNMGKKTCWKTFSKHHRLLSDVGKGDFNANILNNINEFVIKLYTNQESVYCINELAIISVSKTIDKLPPTKDSLYQHSLRVHYQTKIWLGSLQANTVLPNEVNHGWTILHKTFVLVLQTLALPQDVKMLIWCGCKKDLNSLVVKIYTLQY